MRHESKYVLFMLTTVNTNQKGALLLFMALPYILLFYVQRMVYKRTFEYLGNTGLLSIAAFLESKGYKARVFTGITTDAVTIFARESMKEKIFAAGFYCDYDNQSAVEEMSIFFKETYNIPVLVGGPQTIHIGEDFLKKSKCDFLIRGDGEYTLFELLEYMAFNRIKKEDIKGILYLDDKGRMVCNEPRPLIMDLDSLPFPSSSHLLDKSRKYNFPVLSARGCPFRCAFCFEGGNTKTLRLRSVKKVTEEIQKGLEENPSAKYIWFADDTFTLNYDRTEGFCRELKELRKKYDFIWFAEGHPSIICKWPEMVPMMKEAGMARMQIGLESGWSKALEMYNKQMTLSNIEEVVKICRDIDLPQLTGNFIIGGACETEETLLITKEYAEKLIRFAPGLMDIYTSTIMPLPNTAISKEPGRFGIKILDAPYLTSLEDFPVTETETLSRNAISNARFDFVKHISLLFKELFKSGKIPFNRIKKHFELALNYKLPSTWYSYLYSKDRFVNPYFNLLLKTSAVRLEDIKEKELNFYYPDRVSDDMEGLEGVILSPEEYRLLLLCNGRIDIKTVKNMFSSIEEDNLYKILKKLESRYLIVFHRP